MTIPGSMVMRLKDTTAAASPECSSSYKQIGGASEEKSSLQTGLPIKTSCILQGYLWKKCKLKNTNMMPFMSHLERGRERDRIDRLLFFSCFHFHPVCALSTIHHVTSKLITWERLPIDVKIFFQVAAVEMLGRDVGSSFLMTAD